MLSKWTEESTGWVRPSGFLTTGPPRPKVLTGGCRLLVKRFEKGSRDANNLCIVTKSSLQKIISSKSAFKICEK